MKPDGYVELPAEYVSEIAAYGIKLIKLRREENKREALEGVRERSIFGVKLKPRTDAQCIQILDARWEWWFLCNSSWERYEQLKTLVQAARHGKPMLIDVELAANLKYAEQRKIEDGA